MINNLFKRKTTNNKNKDIGVLIDIKASINATIPKIKTDAGILTKITEEFIALTKTHFGHITAPRAPSKNNENSGLNANSGLLKNKDYGVLTLEFAFILPGLAILFYFIVNHYNFYDLKSRIKSSSYLATSIMQNLTNSRADKKLTKADIRRIAFASSLNIFVNDSVFTGDRGINYKLTIKYGKKTASGFEGITIICNTTNKTNPNSIAYSGTSSSSNDSGVALSAVGDEAMTVTAELIPASSAATYDTSKMGFKNLTIGLLGASMVANIRGNFKYQVQITPKPGIIDRTTLNGS